MIKPDTTIDYYDKYAERFVAGTENADMHECRDRFLKYLHPGARILDAGCGSGRDIIAFQRAGYAVDAFDASAELCKIATERSGIYVKNRRFEEITGEEKYDGIWACASLLHVRREDLADVLSRIYGLLRSQGTLYVSFKYGSGECVKDGRYFHYLSDNECRSVLERAGFSVEELFMSSDVRPDRMDEKWVNAIAIKS